MEAGIVGSRLRARLGAQAGTSAARSSLASHIPHPWGEGGPGPPDRTKEEGRERSRVVYREDVRAGAAQWPSSHSAAVYFSISQRCTP